MENYLDFIDDLKKLIEIDSSEKSGEMGAPFGPNVKKALDEFLLIAKRLGFETINYDGYGAEIDYGKGAEIGIIGHVDTVPCGDGWDSNPLALTEKDGYLIGRGVADDKGPSLATLYALNELKKSRQTCNKRFRFFIGCNEETGWRDIEYIKTKTALPKFGFSPDGSFPVSYAEKGVYVLYFSLPELKNFFELNGGTAINAVCGRAEVKTNSTEILEKAKAFGLKTDGNTIISIGKSAHGSAPQKGVNAFKKLFEFMSLCGESLDEFVDFLFSDSQGIMKKENEQGNITFSPNIIEENGGQVFLVCDCRVPAPFTFDKDAKPLFDKMGLKYKAVERHPPFMVDRDSELVKKLTKAYSETVGKKTDAVSSAGSTFARVFECGCAFGFEFADTDYHMHEPNERIAVDKLNLGYEIIKKAIFELAE